MNAFKDDDDDDDRYYDNLDTNYDHYRHKYHDWLFFLHCLEQQQQLSFDDKDQ